MSIKNEEKVKELKNNNKRWSEVFKSTKNLLAAEESRLSVTESQLASLQDKTLKANLWTRIKWVFTGVK